jgi:UDP-galactopyranose mutase
MVGGPRDILVVGAGLSGAVIARELADAGFRVTIIDSRGHVAGNAHDETNPLGIRVHRYGPHMFHTSNAGVVAWLSRFTQWRTYRHRGKAMLADGRLVTFPPNRETAALVGSDNLVDIFYRPYSLKMWGKPLEQLHSSLSGRVPVREDECEDYFPHDDFQGFPVNGYTCMVENVLDHPQINVQLNKRYEEAMRGHVGHVFNSMPIDEYFGFALGELPYRSIRFHNFDLPVPHLYPVPIVNFTHDARFTRVTEWKVFPGHGTNPSMTSITIEEPCDYRDNGLERHYPVKDSDGTNLALHRRYLAMVPDGMTFIGRCGTYAYLDMHQAVSAALAQSRRFLEKR